MTEIATTGLGGGGHLFSLKTLLHFDIHNVILDFHNYFHWIFIALKFRMILDFYI